MKKLIRVVRSAYTPEFHPEGGHNWRRRLPMVIIPVTRELGIDRSNMSKDAEFFLVEPDDVDTAMRAFAENNPGCEVQVYSLEASAQCPAAPMVVKTVTQDGVLPA
jgi:tagatose-1,6-bisphosphate aldolase